MAYFTGVSYLTAGAKSAEERIFLEKLFLVIDQMIDEKVEKYISDHKEAFFLDLKTTLNGKIVDLPAVKSELINQIVEQLRN